MKRRNERAQVADASSSPVITGIAAPLTVPVDDRAERAAHALGQALNIGVETVQSEQDRIYSKAELNATRAFLDGREPTKGELKNDAFRLAHESLRTERSLTDFQNQLSTDYETDRNKPGFEINSWYDGKVKSVYAGLDPENDIDRHVLGFIAPKLEQLRANYVTENGKRAFEDVKSQSAADSVAIFDNIRSSGRAPTEQEWADTESHLWDIGRNDPEFVNQTMLSIVQKAAADGDVATVNSVPATWGENNVPSIRTNAKYAAHFENALIGAQSQNYTNAERIRAEHDRALKETRENTESDIFANMLTGRNPQTTVLAALRSNNLTGDRAESLLSAWRAMNVQGQEGSVNYGLAKQLEVDLHTGAKTQQDVIDAAALIGSGSKGSAMLAHLFEVAHTAQDDKLQTPDAKNWLEHVKAATSPTQSPFSKLDFDGVLDRAQKTAQADALRVTSEQILAGKSPAEAAKAALDAHKALDIKADPTAVRATPAQRQANLRALIDSGEINEDEAISLYTGNQ
jgi:hypothetical protein